MNYTSNVRRNSVLRRGFTLIELLVVIAIIALLTGIVVANLSQSRAKARDAKRVSDLSQIQLGLELFFDRCRAYPDALDLNAGDDGSCPTGVVLGTFLPQIPTDPSGSEYDYAENDTYYILHATLETNNANMVDSITESRSHAAFGGTPGFPCYDGSNTEYCISSPFLPVDNYVPNIGEGGREDLGI